MQHQPDIAMHLAAESHVDRSIDGQGEFIQTKIVGTYTLLEQARAYWTGPQGDKKANFRFHQISTDEGYGDLPHPDEQSGEFPLFTETTGYAASSPYSASKSGSEHLVRAWERTFGLPTLVTNCSTNYGPYHFPEKLIPLVILNALERKPLPVYGKGNQISDEFYVEEHPRASVLVATRGKLGETYNIGVHNEKQNVEVLKTICSMLEELAPSENNPNIDSYSCEPGNTSTYSELIKYVADRPGHDIRCAIDASKIQCNLGWTPQETLESGIRKALQMVPKQPELLPMRAKRQFPKIVFRC